LQVAKKGFGRALTTRASEENYWAIRSSHAAARFARLAAPASPSPMPEPVGGCCAPPDRNKEGVRCADGLNAAAAEEQKSVSAMSRHPRLTPAPTCGVGGNRGVPSLLYVGEAGRCRGACARLISTSPDVAY